MTYSNDESVIADFESRWTGRKNYLHDFIRSCNPVASSDLQFALLKRDLRLRLCGGSFPAKSDYEDGFPHFMAEYDEAIVSEVLHIASNESPIEKLFGQLPREVGGYEVVEQVGRDWVSVHYDAYQTTLSRKVRFRVLLFPTEESVAMACTIARLEHPGLESVVELLRVGSATVIVSQIEQGESVASILQDRPESVTTRQAVRWVGDAADALLELHRHDIEHLNVSPCKLFARYSGGSVLVEPNFSFPLSKITCTDATEVLDFLPFPYRSIKCNTETSLSRRKDDVVALGLVMFVLLTKVSLESFYLNAPLPGETKRLKTLVQSHLEYSSEVDPVLKTLCLRLTLGVMEDIDPCDLLELRNALSEWTKLDDMRMRNELIVHESHSHSGSLASSWSRRFSWFSKQ